jgi:hypothetical protein
VKNPSRIKGTPGPKEPLAAWKRLPARAVRIYRPTDSGATTAMRDGVLYATDRNKAIVRVTPKKLSKKERNRLRK